MDVKKILAINIKYIRYQSGLSQEKFYEKYNLSYKYFAAIERAEKNIGIELLQEIARTFHTTMADLITYDETKVIHKKRIDAKEK